MSARGLALIALCALVQAASNLLLRRGVLLAGGIGGGSGGQLARSILALAQQPLFVLGVLLYGVAALIWFSVLSREALALSYPVLVGITFTLVVLGGTTLFRERLALPQLIGIVIILVGVLLVSRA